MNLGDAMAEAFDKLALYLQCPGHVFRGRPRLYTWYPRGPKHPPAIEWYVHCRNCGIRYSRGTLEQLRAEVTRS